MGYITTFEGEINFPTHISEARVKAIRNRLEQMNDGDEFTVSTNGIEIFADWKNYYADTLPDVEGFNEYIDKHNTMLEVLRRIAVFFPDNARGTIDARGEENDDVWRINVTGKKLQVQQGYIEYEKGGEEIVPTEKQMATIEKLFVDIQEVANGERK